MAVRRYGNRVAFLGTSTSAGITSHEAIGAGATTREAEIGRAESLVIFVSVDGASTISVEAAISSDSFAKDQPSQVSDIGENWYPLYYLDTPISVVFAGAATRAIIIPDAVPGWLRLRSTNAINMTAGFEALTDS